MLFWRSSVQVTDFYTYVYTELRASGSEVWVCTRACVCVQREDVCPFAGIEAGLCGERSLGCQYEGSSHVQGWTLSKYVANPRYLWRSWE